MEYLPGAPTNYLPADFVSIDVGLCEGKAAGHAVHALEGVTRWSLTGTEIDVTQSVWLTHIGGHLHGTISTCYRYRFYALT